MVVVGVAFFLVLGARKLKFHRLARKDIARKVPLRLAGGAMGSPNTIHALTSQNIHHHREEREKNSVSMADNKITGGNEDLTKHIIQLASSEDDPPLVLDWDALALTQCWNTAVA